MYSQQRKKHKATIYKCKYCLCTVIAALLFVPLFGPLANMALDDFHSKTEWYVLFW